MTNSLSCVFKWLAVATMLVQSLVYGEPSRVWKAAVYNGLVVGESSRSEVIHKLGKPNYVGKEQDTGEPIMNFTVTSPVRGELTVHIRHGVLQGLTLIPSATLTRDEVIEQFGRDYLDTHYAMDECLAKGGTAPLYESPTGPEERIEYRSRGLAAVMRKGEVQAIVFEGPPFPPSRSRCSTKGR